jgi:ribosomal protein L6P/L9E
MFYNLSSSIFLKKSTIFDNLIINYFLIHKTYIKCFFSLFLATLQGISHGYKLKIFLKGKGLRLILRKRVNKLPYIYLKLGYSHKIFFTLPKNVWFRVFGRKRALILYTLNYSILRNIILKLRSFYPMSLYKLRGSL